MILIDCLSKCIQAGPGLKNSFTVEKQAEIVRTMSFIWTVDRKWIVERSFRRFEFSFLRKFCCILTVICERKFDPRILDATSGFQRTQFEDHWSVSMASIDCQQSFKSPLKVDWSWTSRPTNQESLVLLHLEKETEEDSSINNVIYTCVLQTFYWLNVIHFLVDILISPERLKRIIKYVATETVPIRITQNRNNFFHK